MKEYIALWLILKLLINWLGVPSENYYNLGNELYKNQKYKQAQKYYQKSFGNKNFNAYYNAGNAAFKQQAYSQAIDYYQLALKIDSQDEDAWHNLELARGKLEKNQELSSRIKFDPNSKAKTFRPKESSKPNLSNTYLKYQPDQNMTEKDMQDILEQAKAREQNFDYLNQDKYNNLDRTSNPDYLFSKSPQELMEYMREQARQRYPSRKSLDKKETLDEIDW